MDQYLHHGRWRLFVAYGITFIILESFWSAHNRIYQTIGRTNGPLLWLNLVHLLGVGLLPFAEEMIMMDAIGPIGSSIYVATLLTISTTLTLIVAYAVRRGGAYWGQTDERATQETIWRSYLSVTVLLLTFVCILNPWFGDAGVGLAALGLFLIVDPSGSKFVCF